MMIAIFLTRGNVGTKVSRVLCSRGWESKLREGKKAWERAKVESKKLIWEVELALSLTGYHWERRREEGVKFMSRSCPAGGPMPTKREAKHSQT